LALEKLRPEEKVNLAINMTKACVRICADAIKDQHRTINEDSSAATMNLLLE